MKDLSPEEKSALERLSLVDRSRLNQIAAEFRGQNDRAAAIVGAAQLDDLLVDLIARFLLPDRKSSRQGKDDSLLGRNRALTSFSSRIIFAQRCGLISSALAESLDRIRDVRNDFAHLTAAADLNSSPYSQWIAGLHRPVPSPTFWQSHISSFGQDTPANQFRAIVSVYAHLLLGDAQNVRRVSAQPLLGANLP